MTSEAPFSPQAAVRMRKIGALVLAAGLAGAGLLYWKGPPPRNLSDEVSTARTSKKLAHEIELNTGKAGLMVNDLMENLQYPKTQAAIMAVASVLVGAGCFYIARLIDRANLPDESAE